METVEVEQDGRSREQPRKPAERHRVAGGAGRSGLHRCPGEVHGRPADGGRGAQHSSCRCRRTTPSGICSPICRRPTERRSRRGCSASSGKLHHYILIFVDGRRVQGTGWIRRDAGQRRGRRHHAAHVRRRITMQTAAEARNVEVDPDGMRHVLHRLRHSACEVRERRRGQHRGQSGQSAEPGKMCAKGKAGVMNLYNPQPGQGPAEADQPEEGARRRSGLAGNFLGRGDRHDRRRTRAHPRQSEEALDPGLGVRSATSVTG